MQKRFLAEAKENKVFPEGAPLWTRFHPEDRVKTPYTSWTFDDTTIAWITVSSSIPKGFRCG